MWIFDEIQRDDDEKEEQIVQYDIKSDAYFRHTYLLNSNENYSLIISNYILILQLSF